MVYRGVQGIFIRGAQVKVMLDPSRILLTLVSFISSASSRQLFIPSMLFRPCIDDLKAHFVSLEMDRQLCGIYRCIRVVRHNRSVTIA